jgi:tRNA-dihydrouridine synthase B
MPSLHIGPHHLAQGLVLAPMAGISDRPFRNLCRQLGADLAVSEMVAADPSLHASRKSQQRLNHQGESEPIAVQLVGADPHLLAETARFHAGQGASMIDINMGCPARKVCRVAAGAALLRDEPLVGRILAAVVHAVTVPVTLKIRTGWDPQQRNGVAIAHIAEASGISALVVHGRTRACGFSGAAEYATLRAIKQAVKIPVIANGDIDSPLKAQTVLQTSGADGLMIGRAAWGCPWIFRDIAHFLATGTSLPPPSMDWIRAIVLGHIEAMHAFYGAHQGMHIARKHLAWYSQSYPQGAAFRGRINEIESPQQQLAVTERFFDENFH